ncbi:uncharacterized protein SPSK_02841 [Sporothrix schenckii 1099-18]|uniref:Uncharacterized protein n=1 Tax=Sporothrix schenckii 1099-18 TaxID=1397361 RepID=A0A0F2MB61_SPOSC|nr:uncharacterized protein SPSK_02841 [Sporothrix schenckii 1099-18]KJR86324.1 hypothetical protein SPSK_02841 [Sporothrix schenckii 1099-18]
MARLPRGVPSNRPQLPCSDKYAVVKGDLVIKVAWCDPVHDEKRDNGHGLCSQYGIPPAATDVSRRKAIPRCRLYAAGCIPVPPGHEIWHEMADTTTLDTSFSSTQYRNSLYISCNLHL